MSGTNKKQKTNCYTLDNLMLCDSEQIYSFVGYWTNPNTKQRYMTFVKSEPPLPEYPNFIPGQTYLLYYRS